MGREGCSEPHWGLGPGHHASPPWSLSIQLYPRSGGAWPLQPPTLEVTHSELRHQMGADRAAWGFHCICVCAHEDVCPCA